MPHFLFQFPPIAFYSARLIHNEMGSFDAGSFENIDINKIPQNEKDQSSEDTEQLEQKYSNAVKELEEELGVSGFEDTELKAELRQIKAQQDYLADVEILLEQQAILPQSFESISLVHLANNPMHVRAVLVQGGHEWNELAESMGDGASQSDKKVIERAVEQAITAIITETIVTTVAPELTPFELKQFSTELKKHNQLRNLYSSQKEAGAYLTHEQLDSFVEDNAPILLEAFRAKNEALAQLPELSDSDPKGQERIGAFLTKYLPESGERELMSWSQLLENVQTQIANEPDPARQRAMFEEFLQECKNNFGDSVEVQIISAIDSDRRFKQLSFLITTTTKVEQAERVTRAIEENRIAALYSEFSGYPTSAVHSMVAEKLTAVENEVIPNTAPPEVGPDARLVVADEFFLDNSSKPSFKPLEQWVKSSDAKIFENPDGSIIIQQNEATQIQLDSHFSEQFDPDIHVVVGDGSFTETGSGRLSELDKTVERANNTLFVRYGLDAEEFIPGGLNSYVGQEIAQKLAGLFFFRKSLDQQSAEQDNQFESLKSKTDNPQFRTRMVEFFGIDALVKSGVTGRNVKEQVKAFFSKSNLLTPTGVLKSVDDEAWEDLREEVLDFDQES